ncbi:MAG: CDP-alcohol phosphatidyltransferase family protein [Myxococcota bacterium]
MTSPTPAAPRPWLTRANLLTAVRLALAPVLVCAVLAPAPVLAALVFALAVGTDLLDGPVARRFGETSPLGGFLDHATDATFVSLGLAACAWTGEIPFLLPGLVVFAFVQYTLDSRVLAGEHLRASALGRYNGIAYFVALGVPVIRDALGLAVPASVWVQGFGWLLVATTLVSMLDRGWALWARRRSS